MRAIPAIRMPGEDRRRGVIVVLAALCLIIVMIFMAFAIDVGYIVLTDTELQNAADSAALAAARGLATDQATAVSKATLWASKNLAANQAVEVTSEDVEFGTWDAKSATFVVTTVNPNAVRVTCRRTTARGNPLKLFFAPALGTKHANVTASAIASIPTSKPRFQFLIDDEMFDTDEPSIEALAKTLKKTPDALLTDANKDGFIDIPAGKTVELPTGQVGDEALFDTQQSAGKFPFGEQTLYTATDFLAEGTALESSLKTKNLSDVQWTAANAPHHDFSGNKVLDPVPGTYPVESHTKIMGLPNPTVTHVAPVFKSDVSMQERTSSKYGSPTANLQGERRGLVAFKILSAKKNPKGGSYLPLLTLEIVDPKSINIKDLSLGGSGSGSSPTGITLVD